MAFYKSNLWLISQKDYSKDPYVLSLSLYLLQSLFIFLSLYLSLSFSLSTSLYLSLSRPLFIFLSLSLPLFIFITLSLPLFIFLSLYLSLYLSLSCSFPISLVLFLSPFWPLKELHVPSPCQNKVCSGSLGNKMYGTYSGSTTLLPVPVPVQPVLIKCRKLFPRSVADPGVSVISRSR